MTKEQDLEELKQLAEKYPEQFMDNVIELVSNDMSLLQKFFERLYEND